jgi:integrase
VSEYLENKQGKGLSRRHLQDLKNRLGKFASFAGEKTASEIKPEQIEHWLQQFGGENHNNYLQRLHGLFNYGIKRGYLAENPTKVIDKVKVAQTEPAIFATELVEALLNAVPRRAVPYFAIGAFAGLRPREIERLDWADIHLEEGYIRVRPKVAKTASNRLVDIQPNLRAWLLPLTRENGPVTTPNIRKIREAAQCKIGLTQWPQDGLRHSYASYHLAHFKNINELATQMGHTDTKLIFRHYRRVVSKSQAVDYWGITPHSKLL